MVKRIRLLTTAFCLVMLAASQGLVAQALGTEPGRADDGGLWHLAGNPALLAADPSSIELGVAYSPMGVGGSAVSLSQQPQDGTVDFGIRSSLAAYYLRYVGGQLRNWIGAALPIGEVAAFGYAYRWGNLLGTLPGWDLGLLVRPVDFASLGLTVATAKNVPPDFGFGLALRPLVFLPEGGSTLTLTADAHYQNGSAAFESVGAHFALDSWVSLRGWYDLLQKSFGVSAQIGIGPSHAYAALPSISDPSLWRAGESVRFTPGAPPPQAPFGKRILKISNLDLILHDQSLAAPLARFAGGQRTASFRTLVDEVRRAASDSRVVGVVLENLPSLGGPASIEEFAAALGLVRKAGKAVFVYANGYQDPVQFQYLASEASWIGVSPAGSINLVGRSAYRLYLKGLLDRLGVRFVNLAPWKTKSAYNNLTEPEMSAAEREMLTRYEGDLQAQALDAFARGRGDRLKKAPEAVLAEGPFVDSSKAIELGVIDGAEYREGFEKLVDERLKGATSISALPEPADDSWGGSLLAPHVAVVELSGSIIAGRGMAGSSIGTDSVALLKRLRTDKSVAAILIRINSPGGVVDTSDQIAHEVRLAREAGKPVVVSMGDYAASGGYYVSADAARIFAEPATITGSIGVTGLVPDLSEALAKLGVTPSGVALSPSAATLNPLLPLRQRDLDLAHTSILAYYDRFVGVVSSGRKMGESRVRELGRGQVWTGREAKANGLVDDLGGLDAAKAWLATKLGGRVEYRTYRPGERSPFGGLIGGGGTLGEGVSASVAAALGLDPARSAAAVRRLTRAAGPLLYSLSGALELGSGPLYYFAGE